MKNPLTPAGIEPATFGFVAQHLNHCATAVPIYIYIYIVKGVIEIIPFFVSILFVFLSFFVHFLFLVFLFFLYFSVHFHVFVHL